MSNLSGIKSQIDNCKREIEQNYKTIEREKRKIADLNKKIEYYTREYERELEAGQEEIMGSKYLNSEEDVQTFVNEVNSMSREDADMYVTVFFGLNKRYQMIPKGMIKPTDTDIVNSYLKVLEIIENRDTVGFGLLQREMNLNFGTAGRVLDVLIDRHDITKGYTIHGHKVLHKNKNSTKG